MGTEYGSFIFVEAKRGFDSILSRLRLPVQVCPNHDLYPELSSKTVSEVSIQKYMDFHN